MVIPKTSYRFLALAFAGSITAIACGEQYAEQSTTTTTAAAAPVHGGEIETIASARCAREARCDNVGAGKRYVSREGCLTELRGGEMNELTTTSCPRGVDQRALDKCLGDINGERCENAFDSFNRLNSCAKDSLCPRP